jgi:predicted AAA+ superfamily ATPase
MLCHLLGIRSPAQLREHPLRGAVFESWVVSEILKARVHRGLPPALSFFRDRKGAEVDVIVETAEGLVAVETKSAQTVAEDFFAGLGVFGRLHGSSRRRRSLEKVVVYGGAERQGRSEGTVLPWAAVPGYRWGA